MQDVASTLVMWVFPGLMLVAAVTDLLWRRIPNWISGALIAGFMLLAFSSGMDFDTLWQSLAVGLAALAVGFILFAIGQMGGGDAKLIATSVLWFGATMPLLEYIVAFSIYGAVLSLVFLLRRFHVVQLMLVSNRFSAKLAGTVNKGREVPYGIAIGIAALEKHTQLVALHLGG